MKEQLLAAARKIEAIGCLYPGYSFSAFDVEIISHSATHQALVYKGFVYIGEKSFYVAAPTMDTLCEELQLQLHVHFTKIPQTLTAA